MSTIKLKRIAVHETVYQQLKSLGSAGDSFNDVLVRILAAVQAADGIFLRKLVLEVKK